MDVLTYPDREESVSGYLYDFGENTAGVPVLRVKGERGQKIEMIFGEYMHFSQRPATLALNTYNPPIFVCVCPSFGRSLAMRFFNSELILSIADLFITAVDTSDGAKPRQQKIRQDWAAFPVSFYSPRDTNSEASYNAA